METQQQPLHNFAKDVGGKPTPEVYMKRLLVGRLFFFAARFRLVGVLKTNWYSSTSDFRQNYRYIAAGRTRSSPEKKVDGSVTRKKERKKLARPGDTKDANAA